MMGIQKFVHFRFMASGAIQRRNDGRDVIIFMFKCVYITFFGAVAFVATHIGAIMFTAPSLLIKTYIYFFMALHAFLGFL